MIDYPDSSVILLFLSKAFFVEGLAKKAVSGLI